MEMNMGKFSEKLVELLVLVSQSACIAIDDVAE